MVWSIPSIESASTRVLAGPEKSQEMGHYLNIKMALEDRKARLSDVGPAKSEARYELRKALAGPRPPECLDECES